MSITVNDLNDSVLVSLSEQLRDLQPVLEKQVELADVTSKLTQLATLLDGTHGIPANASLSAAMQHSTTKTDPGGIIDQITNLASGEDAITSLGGILILLSVFQQSLQTYLQGLLNSKSILQVDADAATDILLAVIVRVRQLLNFRPDVGAIMDDLSAIKALSGGPADAVAFHDFHVLQIAFKNVWLHAFSDNLKIAAANLYDETVRHYDDLGLKLPNYDAVKDIAQLGDFINQLQTATDPSFSPTVVAPPSLLVTGYFPEAVTLWSLFSDEQRSLIESDAGAIEYHKNHDTAGQFASDGYVQQVRDEVDAIVKNPMGSPSRLTRLIAEIGQELSEPYAFDVFAPDSYNYGLMITYRQRWEPGPYQAGDLAATIPLAPGETRKFSKKRVVKESVSKKMMEKSMESRSMQSSETNRAELEILDKVTTATNFKLTTKGAFNIGIGSFESTSEFGGNASNESTKNKKEFHEATLKAAEEYRKERSIEVDTSSSIETEDTVSGELSNPNNEITVTYLFYELQRRYRIHEFLYRVRPVILVAQDVPSPHEIDEAWLIRYQWIISRVLLDDSFKPALTYLTSGFAGDEISIEVLKTQWDIQQRLVNKLERLVDTQQAERDQQREALVESALKLDLIPEMPGVLNFFTMGMDPSDGAKQELKAYRKAGESRLKYTEEALADAQDKLRKATSSFEQATKEYAEAIKNQYTRHINIDQLRVHVKQNIFYYMQAIWSHEDPDQRFFRLYNKKVMCPVAQANCPMPAVISKFNMMDRVAGSLSIEIENTCVPSLGGGGVGGNEHELIEVADVDNPLGFKGNYIVFPLKDDCALTTYMLSDYIDNYLGVRDPDGSGDFDAEQFDEQWTTAEKAKDQPRLDALKTQLLQHIEDVQEATDEIIVPTGQLFIEALPGTHPLLEDFKLMHRFQDVRKVKAEVRHAELENLRLASRVVAGQNDTALLSDPDVDKKVVVVSDGKVGLNTDT